ncbi:Crp/Fnr family transcriptional regulator [Algoriphagus terrigena]|uniref:Crp/Fnr family transcriptional regulator n=1 Tax=Algoriphagus terrigena TaxID=344884 RepID=UPI0004787921|nr:Crp/Fnr family transcriptional regulator [Algoriphagus terrigena]
MSESIFNIPCASCSSWKHSLFSDLHDSELCAVSSRKKLAIHRKGQVLYSEGTKPLGLFCINSGVVKVYKTASNGKDQIIHFAQRGELLGIAALLGAENYSNSATIVEDAKICFVPQDVFFGSLLHNPDLKARVAKSLSHELGALEEKLVNATQKNIRERLAFMLLQLGDTYRVEGGENPKIDLTLSRSDLAGIVGTTTESIIRLLSEFNKDRLIELEGKNIVIRDRTGLSRMSDFYGK